LIASQNRHLAQQIIVHVRRQGAPEPFAISRGFRSPGSGELIRITPRSPGQAVNRCGRQIDLLSDGANPFGSWEKVVTCDDNASPCRGGPVTPGPTASADRANEQ
jgi:hypothetical protein